MTRGPALGTMQRMNIANPHTADARASIAAALSAYYSELTGTQDKPAPKFSLARMLDKMATEKGLTDGWERELAGATATLAGQPFDSHRCIVPLQALGRNLTAGTPSAGGYLIAADGAPQPYDVLRPYSVAVEAGCTVLSNLKGSLTLPRVTGASAAQWVSAEDATYTDAQPTFGAVTLVPRTGAAGVFFSRQWSLQTEATEAVLRQQLFGAAGALIDAAVLAGTGASGSPVGIVSTPGVGTQAGGSFNHAAAIEMRRQVLAAGGREDRLRWIAAPGVQAVLGARERASGGGLFVWHDGAIMGRPAHATSTAPASTLILGDFSQCVLAFFGPPALQIEVDPYAGFISGRLAARIVIAVDVAVVQASAFSVATSVS